MIGQENRLGRYNDFFHIKLDILKKKICIAVSADNKPIITEIFFSTSPITACPSSPPMSQPDFISNKLKANTF